MPAVLVFAEANGPALTEGAAALISAASSLAGSGGIVAAVVVGSLPEGGVPGASRVFFAKTDGTESSELRAAALLEAAGRINPDLVLIPNSIAGMDIAAIVALHLGRPLLAYCTRLARHGEMLVAECRVFGSRAIATVEYPLPAVVLADLEPAAAGQTAAPSEIIELALPADTAPRIHIEPMAAAADSAVDIAAAERIVCVGRGIGDAANIALARELADALGAELAATRPVVDLGWVEKERQIGKSGRSVKPKLYVGVGVSGAAEHLEGMRHAAAVVAVNINPSAPIFEVARWGTTCDALELLPLLTEKLRAAKA